MTRKKVKLAFITNDSARKATFKKRKKGLMKKVSELSTLCGIDACAIIYSPYESQPEVWPSALGVQRVLAQFKRMPEMEQSKKMVNQESFIRQRIAKANEQLKKQHKDNREKEMTEVMFQCLTGRGLQSLAMPDLHDLGWLIDQNLKEIYRKIESLKKSSSSSAPPPPPPLPPSPRPRPHPHPHPHPHHHHPQVVGAPRNTSGGNIDHVVMGEINGHDQKPAVDQLMMNGADVAMQRPQWFAEWMMNNNEPMGFGGDEMMLPFGDNHNSLWSSAFFP